MQDDHVQIVLPVYCLRDCIFKSALVALGFLCELNQVSMFSFTIYRRRLYKSSLR